MKYNSKSKGIKDLLRDRVNKKYDGHCAYCGQQINIKKMQIDHIIPKRHFDYFARKDNLEYKVDDFINLNPSCRACNSFKTFWTLEEFREELEQQVNRGRQRSVNFRMAEKFGLIKVIKNTIMFYFEKTGI